MLIEGAVNLEGAMENCQAICKCVIDNNLNEMQWGAITDLRKYELSTPEAIDEVKKNYDWTVANGQRYAARIVNSVIKSQLANQLSNAHHQELIVREFDELVLAEKWFKELGLL